MLRAIITFGIILVLWPHAAIAQISQEIQEAIFVMHSLCLVRSELTIEAEGGGSILILNSTVVIWGGYVQSYGNHAAVLGK